MIGLGRTRVALIGTSAKAAAAAEMRPLAGPEAGNDTGPGFGDRLPADSGAEALGTDAYGRMEGASRAERLAETDFRKIDDPNAMAEAHALAARLAKAMSAEQDFAALGIEAKALGAKLSGAAVGEAKAAQALARLGEAELQKRLELQNRKQARDFKRMLRSGLERL